MKHALWLFPLLGALGALLHGCVVDGVCRTSDDCHGNEICRNNVCALECLDDSACELDRGCVDNRCVLAKGCIGCPYPQTAHGQSQCIHGLCKVLACDAGYMNADNNPRNGCECDQNAGPCTPADGDDDPEQDAETLTCPSDMVNIDNLFCMDTWEASRPDATADAGGSDPGAATSRPGVIPWLPVSKAIAAAACETAGKRLCNAAEWEMACQGPAMTVYGYGDDYDPVICNGIDSYCRCDPYPHCFDDCGADYHVMPTQSFAGCVNGYGLYDINGNVWELVNSSDASEHFRGGAYNCSDSEALHKCTYDATWGPTAKGFRCCK